MEERIGELMKEKTKIEGLIQEKLINYFASFKLELYNFIGINFSFDTSEDDGIYSQINAKLSDFEEKHTRYLFSTVLDDHDRKKLLSLILCQSSVGDKDSFRMKILGFFKDNCEEFYRSLSYDQLLFINDKLIPKLKEEYDFDE